MLKHFPVRVICFVALPFSAIGCTCGGRQKDKVDPSDKTLVAVDPIDITLGEAKSLSPEAAKAIVVARAFMNQGPDKPPSVKRYELTAKSDGWEVLAFFPIIVGDNRFGPGRWRYVKLDGNWNVVKSSASSH